MSEPSPAAQDTVPKAKILFNTSPTGFVEAAERNGLVPKKTASSA